MKLRDEFANVRRRRQRHARWGWARNEAAPQYLKGDVGALFLDASHENAPGVPDCTRLDKKANLYGAGSGGEWIISAEGKHLRTIKVPETVSNVAWGDKDSKTLYITASTSVYRIKLRVPGVEP